MKKSKTIISLLSVFLSLLMVLFSLPLETIAAELQNEGEGNEVLLEEEPNSSEKPVDALFELTDMRENN